MSESSQPLQFSTPDEGEELARAEIYGLLSRLWFAAPDADLMQQFAVAVTEAPQSGAYLEDPWERLVAAMRAFSLHEITDEYDALFYSVSKPEVFLYGSYYLSGHLNERPLADLRQDLLGLGLAMDNSRGDTEDHVSFVLEVMRYLIAGDDVAVCNLEQQRLFFRRHVQPWVGLLCDAVNGNIRAEVYARLADFTRAFIEVETQGFDLIE